MRLQVFYDPLSILTNKHKSVQVTMEYETKQGNNVDYMGWSWDVIYSKAKNVNAITRNILDIIHSVCAIIHIIDDRLHANICTEII